MTWQKLTSAARSIAALLCAILLSGGCTTSSIYAPEHLLSGQEDLLTVHLKDGRSIRLAEGDYRVNKSDGGSITGTGRLLTGLVDNSTRPWEGTISLGEIQSVSTTRLGVLGYAGIAFLGFSALFFIFLLSLGTSSFHT